jgi:cephalosporin-C deacetylase-like acetyl esterase
MNHNLDTAWNDGCSKPLTQDMVFYSRQSENMLFEAIPTIEIHCQATLRSLSLKWTLCRNKFTTPFTQGMVEAKPGNLFVIRLETTKLLPGFYDLHVELDTGMPKLYKAVCVFGYRVSEMQLAKTDPVDFVSFWEKAVASLSKIPLDSQAGPMETFDAKAIGQYNLEHACLPADYDPMGHVVETVESCKVNFAGPDGGRVYGYLSKPLGDGPFPIMLVLPGAGFNRRPRPLEHARHGFLAMDIQVHGQDVDLEGKYPVPPGYHQQGNITSPQEHYYYNVHLRCVQAINYLCSRPDADPSRIVLVGGSQGGRLGIVVAGIDHRVSAVVSCIANSPNMPYLQWFKVCNDKHDDGMSVVGAPPLTGDDMQRCSAYIDPMNYAPHIQCPVLMNVGLIDPVSPPVSVFSVYQRLNPKLRELVVIPNTAHDWSAAFDIYAWKWVSQQLKANKH